MLAKEKRLNLKKDFSWVASGERSSDTCLKLFFRFGANQEPRVGISVSKGTFKKATDRNRARRLISAAIEPIYGKLASGLNLILLPREEIIRSDLIKIKEELEVILTKHRLLRED